MDILITGGAGFIGSHLADELAKDRSNRIIAMDNLRRGSVSNLKAAMKTGRVTFIEADIRDQDSFKKIGKADVIYHLGAQSNVSGSHLDPDYAVSTNISGTYNVLKFAAKNKVKRFVFASSREVYGNPSYTPVDESHPLGPINIYGTTKVCGEYLCRDFSGSCGLNITIARMTNGYGSRDKDRVIPIFLEKARKGLDLEMFGGNQTLDFIWIGDIVSALMAISSRQKFIGETVNIGSGVATSVEELAKLLVRLTGSKSKIVRKEQRSFDVASFVAASKKIKLSPLSLEEGLKRMISMEAEK
jgi:nucleoside-diphosphate-sugar epimerase